MYDKSFISTDIEYDKCFLYKSHDSECLVAPVGNSQMIPPGFYRKWNKIDEISFLPLRVYGKYGVLIAPEESETLKEIDYIPDWLSGDTEINRGS